ncbi:MAG: DUF503 domain-containing protein [Armatimonadota bacterium]|nr:MAG: DUF503 domain-containing protein [Armatimonadota bacterium]
MYSIGAGTLELEVTDSLTLKDKRQVVKGLLDRLRRRFNVAAAEVDHLDSPRFATLAICAVANDQAVVHSILEKAVDLVESEPRAALLSHDIEML